MDSIIPTARNVCLWAAAVLLGSLPLVVGIDFGGILDWTQYVVALAVAASVVLAIAGSVGDRQQSGLRRHVLLVPLAAWALYGWIQCVSIPETIVRFLSPASADAYTAWIAPFLNPTELPSRFPVSIAADQSRHAVAMILVVAGVAWAAATVAHSRNKITWLLSAVAIGAALHAMLGVVGLLDPRFLDAMLGHEHSANRFGGFINRNNAALMLNLGIASGLGILSWRLTALTGSEVDDEAFEFNDLVALMSDRESMIGVVSVVAGVGGLLVGGSRGGVVAAVIGLMLALGWVRRRRGLVSLPVVVTVLAVCAAILLVPTNLSLESIRRLEIFSDNNQSTLLRNGRLDHWPDGFRAAVAHLPAGAGLGTYAYAYLPHQHVSTGSGASMGSWFHHADNLWLELLVEQGIIGIALALVVLALVVRALARLSESPDPIDQGLRITGWYAIGAVVASQFFDFGLILPANLLAVTILFAAIVARSDSVGLPVMPEEMEGYVYHGVGGAAPTEDARLAPPHSDPLDAHDHPPTDAAPTGTAAIESSAGERTDDSMLNAATTPEATVPSRFPRRRRTLPLLGFAPAAFALFAVVTPLGTLRDDAWADHVIRDFDAHWEITKGDEAKLEAWESRLSQQLTETPRAEIRRRLADVAIRQARLTETVAARPRTEQEFAQKYRETGSAARTMRRLDPSVDPLGEGCGEDPYGYGEALRAIGPALAEVPLDPKSRPVQIDLDFVHCDADRARAAIDQLQTFYRNSPPRVIRLGTEAAARGDIDVAVELWRRALKQHPGYTRRVASLFRDVPTIDPIDVLPETEPVYQAAARFELGRADADERILERAVDVIRCETASSGEKLGDCHQLKADVCYRLGRPEEGFEHHRKALDREPRNEARRMSLIRKLIEGERFDEARELAREGRLVLPDQAARFDAVLSEIAAIEKANVTGR